MRLRLTTYTLAALSVAWPAAPVTRPPQPSAVEQYRSLKTNLRDARAKNDWPAYRSAAQALRLFLNSSPQSLLQLSLAEARAGDADAALRELEQFAAMGQSTDLVDSMADFAPIRTNPKYASIQSAMKGNTAPVARASTAFILSDPALLAEDIDYDPASKRFFITSVREKKIIAVAATEGVTANSTSITADFAVSPDNWPMMALKVDSAHGIVWATEVALNGFTFSPKADWGRSALLGFEIHSGKLQRRIEGPRGSALGDMALTTDGGVIVSDGDGGGVYRLAAGARELTRIDKGDFISPQTPAMLPDGKHIFIPDYLRGIAIVDSATSRARWLDPQGRFALDGVDGLCFSEGKLLAVQNGASPERVVAFTLDPSLERITAETVIERSTATLGDPTHGVVIGTNLFYIANSGWDVIDDHGNLKAGTALTPPRIMRTALP